jgi:hypothetical protein
MIFTPGQIVTVLDTTHRPAGEGVVQEFNPDSEFCEVLFLYPGKDVAERITIPAYRLRVQSADIVVN